MDENKTLSVLLKFSLDKSAQQRVISGASDISKELNRIEQQALATQTRLDQLSKDAEKSFRQYSKTFALGAGITGGIFAAAQRYVANAKIANETTKAWAEQTERLSKSESRIGEVIAKQALPMLKTAADLAGKAANFVEKNPEIIKAALNIGTVVASLGAVGMAVTKGIKIYADVKMVAVGAQQLLAGKLMAEAAKEQLAAAAAGKGLGGAVGGAEAIGAGGGVAATASSVLLPIVTTVAALLAGSYLGTKLGNSVGRAAYGDKWEDKGFSEAMKGALTTTKQIALLASPLHLVASEAANLGVISKETESKIFNLQKRILGLGDSAEATKVGVKMQAPAGFAGVTDAQKSIVDSYVKMLDAEKQATKEYNAARLKINKDAQEQELQLQANGRRARLQVIQAYDKQVETITANYQKASAQSEQNYANQRAQTVRAGGVEIQRIEQDHQDNLRKMLMEHNDRVNDLVANRDALGLVREMRDFDRKKQEEENATNKEIARRRQDIAQNLRDMAQQHAQERAQRLADYKQQLKDAADQKKEALKQISQQYKAEHDALQKARTQALRDLDLQNKAEAERRRAAFIAQIRDLDASMLGEQKRKNQYYLAMLKDVEAFTAAYRKALPSGGNVTAGVAPVRDQGGYTTKGLYAMAQDGRPEFVLSGPTTKAAESAIGGSLTQERMIAALTGKGRSINYTDSRRFDSRISLKDRLLLKQDMVDVLNGVMG